MAPRMAAGEISAARTGTVLDFGPMPRPRKSREIKRCHHVFVRAPPGSENASGHAQHEASEGERRRSQIHPRPAHSVDQKIAPRRPSQRLRG